jgi:DNA gyrase subunit A
MSIERPDLSGIDPEVREYIEALEKELVRLRGGEQVEAAGPEPEIEVLEAPGHYSVLSYSAAGWIKRTPRHLYSRQRRGGMGIFDLDASAGDGPAGVAVVDEERPVILLTDRARLFRLDVRELPALPVRARGQLITDYLPLQPEERIAVVLPVQDETYVTVLTRRGMVRWFGGYLFRENLQPGASLYNVQDLGAPVGACWTASQHELFIATRQGLAIRFAQRQIPNQGCLGIRLEGDDVPVGIAAVRPESAVLLISADGKGTLRLMSGFAAQKAPGSGGKTALKTDALVAVVAAGENDDVFILSRLSKLIRFGAAEIPAKEGVVQGVNCMALRADSCVAAAVSSATFQ